MTSQRIPPPFCSLSPLVTASSPQCYHFLFAAPAPPLFLPRELPHTRAHGHASLAAEIPLAQQGVVDTSHDKRRLLRDAAAPAGAQRWVHLLEVTCALHHVERHLVAQDDTPLRGVATITAGGRRPGTRRRRRRGGGSSRGLPGGLLCTVAKLWRGANRRLGVVGGGVIDIIITLVISASRGWNAVAVVRGRRPRPVLLLLLSPSPATVVTIGGGGEELLLPPLMLWAPPGTLWPVVRP